MGNYCPSGRATRAREEISDHLTDDLRTKMSMINFKQRTPDGSEVIRSKADILKDYRVVKKIGKGLFSKVYLAIDPSGRKVGLKMILKKDFVAKEAIEKIIIEKEILRRVDHRNVLKLYRTMQTNSKIYFVLEYADKGNLLNIINSKRLSPEQIRVILAQVIEALFYLHSKGIIYGDLKAENILINKAGTVKLCDFNLSGTTSILNDTIQGTVSYIAPEILYVARVPADTSALPPGQIYAPNPLDAFITTYARLGWTSPTGLQISIAGSNLTDNETPHFPGAEATRLRILATVGFYQ